MSTVKFTSNSMWTVIWLAFTWLIIIMNVELASSSPSPSSPLAAAAAAAAPAASAAATFRIIWWHFPPYLIAPSFPTQGNPKTIHGVLGNVINTVLTRCFSEGKDTPTFLQVDNTWDFQTEIEKLMNTTETVLCLLFPMKTGYRPIINLPERVIFQADGTQRKLPYSFIPVVESPGAVQFYRKADEAVGSDLLTVILQGWPLLILILLGASYSGIIIWLLDRLWNPSNFPKPFVRGFWEGFWWAFVTMTTVGYGDTTPRSVQARIYGLIWIVVGITILSVFTATVTTVLTQESLGEHHKIQGLSVAVLNGTEEYRLALEKGGLPVSFSSFEELAKVLAKGKPDGALLDQYSFAAQQDELDDTILVEQIIENPVQHGMMLSGPDDNLNECIRKATEQASTSAFMELTKWIHPLTTKTTSAAEQAETLFQPRTIMYMWYGMAAWLIVFVGFVLWEFVYWRPKHKKNQEKKLRDSQDFEVTSTSIDDETLEIDTTCNHCRRNTVIKASSTESRPTNPTSNTTKTPTQVSSKKHQLKPSDQTTLSDQPIFQIQVTTDCERKPHKRLQNGFLANESHHGQNYANPGFVPEVEGLVGEHKLATGSEVDTTTSVVTLDALESLVLRQKSELVHLRDEYEKYRRHWEDRLKELKKHQREERREYLRMLQDSHRNVDDTTSENASDLHGVVTPQNDLSGYDDVVSYNDAVVNIYEV